MKLLRFLLRTARDGRRKLSPGSGREVRQFVDSQRHASGGYIIPRDGTPDLYYTLFGASLATVLGSMRHLLAVRSYLASVSRVDLDLPHTTAFAVLQRMTFRKRPALQLTDFATADGGFSHMPREGAGTVTARESRARREHKPEDSGKIPTGGSGTAYGAYLALILCEALRLDYPRVQTGQSLKACRTDDGGLANTPGQPRGITTATAAGIMIATCGGVKMPVDGMRAFLLDRAADSGGFCSWAKGEPDLLSTATALCALKASGGIPPRLRTPLARFVENCWTGSGGFREAPDHGLPDVEYTFYALLALGCL